MFEPHEQQFVGLRVSFSSFSGVAAFFMSEPFLDYSLPAHLIAQHPNPHRDESRLLVCRRNSDVLEHRRFCDLPELLKPGDHLVLNDTRVVPARLLGRRERTGGKWEGLFLQAANEGSWEMLCQTRGRLVAGETILVDPWPLRLQLVEKTAEGHWIVKPHGSAEINAALDAGATSLLLEKFGRIPLPPYVRKGLGDAVDRERYQTVYARRPGAVAAPTAGLHFTPQVFERLTERGIGWSFVTLHVGLGTFQTLPEGDFTSHQLHREWCDLPEATAQTLNQCRQRGGRIVAVGTTAVRVLETVAGTGRLRPFQGETQLFIYPPYKFQAIDALITNFHLPRSSLLLLVQAFAGIESTRQAYKTAIEQEYLFFSYGDAMLIV